MKTYPTIPGAGYVVTVVTAPCDVSAVLEGGRSILLLHAGKTGQFGFIAPSSQITVDDNAAIISKTDYSVAMVGAKQNRIISPPPVQGLISYWDFSCKATLSLLPDLVGPNDLLAYNSINGCNTIENGAGIYSQIENIGYRGSAHGFPTNAEDESLMFVVCSVAVRQIRSIQAFDYGDAATSDYAEKSMGAYENKFVVLNSNILFGEDVAEYLNKTILLICSAKDGVKTLYSPDWPVNGVEYTLQNRRVLDTGYCTIGGRIVGNSIVELFNGKIYCAGIANKFQDPTKLFEWVQDRYGNSNLNG